MSGNLELWVNAYATVDDVDSLMKTSHQEWTVLDPPEKEDLILRATTAIDKTINPAGEPESETQALKFPRVFEGNWENVFTKSGQEERLLLAVVSQITRYLNEGASGLTKDQLAEGKKPEWVDLDMSAKSYLEVYIV